jgi:hypothetical protein
MKIILEEKSNGIFTYIIIKIKDPISDFPIEKIKRLVEKYNKEQIKRA